MLSGKKNGLWDSFDFDILKDNFLDIISFTGNVTKLIFKVILIFVKLPFKYLKKLFVSISDFFRVRLVKSFRLFINELREVFKESKEIRKLAKSEAEIKNKSFISMWFSLCMKLVKKHKKLFRSILNRTAPIVAIIVLAMTINYYSTTTLALAINYNGESIGYILDESVFHEAEEMARERLETGMSTVTETASDVLSVPTYEFKRISKNMLTDAVAICDKIIEGSSYDITTACGVYIDNEFICAVKNETDAISVFENVLEKKSQPGETADYLQDINYKQGLYPDRPETIWGTKELTQKAESISIKTVKTEKIVETVPFKTETIKSSVLYAGDTKITVKGENGTKTTTKLITYINGKKVSEKIASQKITKKPVTQKVLVGTMQKFYHYDEQSNKGKFLWPVPAIREISSHFGYSWGRTHQGLDISGAGVTGQDIVAAESGVVESVSMSNSGYGHSLVINHGGGIRTRYAHCIAGSIAVKTGQKVSKGQVIAAVGSTGNSTGAHLHFEVLVNGTPVDPLKYL